MSRNIHVFTHCDLDGAGCLLALIWAFPNDTITYTIVSSPHSFKTDVEKAISHKPLSKYDKVFVTDLCILQDDLSLVDYKNVIFIDHHKTSDRLTFRHANNFAKDFTSCTLLIYKLFKSSLELSSKQKQLLIYIDDYDSYTLKFSKSKELNTLYWAHYNNNMPLFLNDYSEGISELTPLQSNAINLHNQKIHSAISNLQLFTATANIQNTVCKIIAAFSDIAINDVADFILSKYKPDICIIVNLKNSRVSFRRINKNVDVSLLAQKLCDGGGHEAAAGGKITEQFLTFSKTLTPFPYASP